MGMTASVKAEKKVVSLQDDNRLLIKTSEELMRNYGEQKISVGKM